MRKEKERLRREEEAQKRAELTRRKLEGQEIVPGLFVGGRLAASNPDWIMQAVSESKLSAILNCTPNVRNFFDFSALDSPNAETDDNGERELEELDSLIANETQDIKEELSTDATSAEPLKEADKVDAKKLVDLLTQEPDATLLPSLPEGQEGIPADDMAKDMVTQQPMTGEEVFFATLETMSDDAKLAILESIAIKGDEPDAEAIKIKQEEDEADRKSAELVKETEILIQRSKQRLTSSQQAAVSLNIKLSYERIAIDDNGGIELSTWFEKASSFIGEVRARGEAVLVHCREGRSRSVTMCVAYMMIGMKMTLKDAMERIHEAIFDENVNAGFKRQLMDLDFELHGSNSIDFNNRKSRTAKLNSTRTNSGMMDDDIASSNARKSKRTRNTRKSGTEEGVIAEVGKKKAGRRKLEDEDEEDFLPDDSDLLPPLKIKAIRLVMTPPSSQQSSNGADEDENQRESEDPSSFAGPLFTTSTSSSAMAISDAKAITTATHTAEKKDTKPSAMEVDESEIIDIETPAASTNDAKLALPTTSNGEESKMQVDEPVKNAPSATSGASAPSSSAPKKAPSTPKKTASNAAKATASPSKPGGGKKKTAMAPPAQSNTLFNYFKK